MVLGAALSVPARRQIRREAAEQVAPNVRANISRVISGSGSQSIVECIRTTSNSSIITNIIITVSIIDCDSRIGAGLETHKITAKTTTIIVVVDYDDITVPITRATLAIMPSRHVT